MHGPPRPAQWTNLVICQSDPCQSHFASENKRQFGPTMPFHAAGNGSLPKALLMSWGQCSTVQYSTLRFMFADEKEM